MTHPLACVSVFLSLSFSLSLTHSVSLSLSHLVFPFLNLNSNFKKKNLCIPILPCLISLLARSASLSLFLSLTLFSLYIADVLPLLVLTSEKPQKEFNNNAVMQPVERGAA